MIGAGSFIGAYRVRRPLGSGGMGEVYEAVHLQDGRPAALKVLHPDHAQNPQFVARFFNEARAINLVRHPGIVEIYEFAQLPDGTVFIAMEYLEGESLGERIRRLGKNCTAAELGLFRQIASALAAAHEKSIIHRDLKPENVMIVKDFQVPGWERAKVVDFGIAKMAPQRSEPSEPRLTQTGMIMGTAHYMSPEQCAGTTLSCKSDVYALGVMLYETLSGLPPFDSDLLSEVMVMHVRTAPRPLREVAPAASADLAMLVHSLLAKSPGERPDMSRVAAELDRLLTTNTYRSPEAFASFVTDERTSLSPSPVAPRSRNSHTTVSRPGVIVEPAPPGPAPRSRFRPSGPMLWAAVAGAAVALLLSLGLGRILRTSREPPREAPAAPLRAATPPIPPPIDTATPVLGKKADEPPRVRKGKKAASRGR